jgi:hypothetical protein
MKQGYTELYHSNRPIMLTRTQRRAQQARRLLVIILGGAFAAACIIAVVFFGLGYIAGTPTT